MAFLVEDGTGLPASNGYIDTTFADTYHADRGSTAWEFSDTGGTVAITTQQKQQAIVRATDHVDKVFGARFRGYVKLATQALMWPRIENFNQSRQHPYDRFPIEGVPVALQKAVAEYALRALLYGNLTPDPPPTGPRQAFTSGESLAEYGDGGSGEVTSFLDKTGPLTTETKYAPGTSGDLPAHAGADLILVPLLEKRSNRLIRG
jgi:hypothetical protein